MKKLQIEQEHILNKNLIIKLIALGIFLILLYVFLLRNTDHDVRLYVFINQQIKTVRKLNGISNSKIIPVNQNIEGLVFDGTMYVTKGNSMVLIIKKPLQSGWLFTNLTGGECYKLFGEGNPQALLLESRKLCVP